MACIIGGSPGYRASLERVFFPDASRRTPPAVVHPRTTRDLSTVLQVASAAGGRVTVRGGGLSSNCVDDSAVMIDLSVHFGCAEPDGLRAEPAPPANAATAARPRRCTRRSPARGKHR